MGYSARMENAAYQVKLPIFEGPLDLLLHLIRKNEVDIHDIPISLITSQYVEYIELMEQLNIELAGEFLVMAATLIHIKSKMLLPRAVDQDEPEDPRNELVLPLLDYLRFKEAARKLDKRKWLDRDVFLRGTSDEIEPQQSEPMLFNMGLFDLLDAFKKVMDNLSHRRSLAVRIDFVSVQERIAQLMEIFREKDDLVFEDLFSETKTKAALVVTFLALLEIIRLRFINFRQETQYGPIYLSVRREAFIRQESEDDE
jgi:segregation and condensation protein A